MSVIVVMNTDEASAGSTFTARRPSGTSVPAAAAANESTGGDPEVLRKELRAKTGFTGNAFDFDGLTGQQLAAPLKIALCRSGGDARENRQTQDGRTDQIRSHEPLRFRDLDEEGGQSVVRR